VRDHRRNRAVLVAAALVFVAYARVVGHELVWDDRHVLEADSPYANSGTALAAIFDPFVLYGGYFRPVALLTFVLEIAAGAGPAIQHLDNVILHVVNAVLVGALVAWLARDLSPAALRWCPAVGTLVYGLHPALVESVAFLSARFDLLATTLVLCATWADARIGGRVLRPLVVAGTFLGALLSKEMAVSFLVVLPLWQMARTGRAGARALHVPTILAVVGATVGWLGLRAIRLEHVLGTPEVAAGALPARIILVARVLAEYLALSIWPFTTLAPIHHHRLPVSSGDALAWVSVAACVAGAAALVAWIRRAPRQGAMALAAATSIAPVSWIVPLSLGGGAIVAERFLALPLALATIAVVPPVVSWAAGRGFGRGLALAALGSWLVASAVVVERTLPHWRDDRSLWTWAARRAPDSALPRANLATVANEQGRHDEALRLAREAIDRERDNAIAWNQAGLALFRSGSVEDARAHFRRAAELAPDRALFVHNEGLALLATGRFAEAEERFRNAAVLAPADPETWNSLAASLLEQARPAEALAVLERHALVRSPDDPRALLNLGLALLALDRPGEAIDPLARASRTAAPAERGRALALLDRARRESALP